MCLEEGQVITSFCAGSCVLVALIRLRHLSWINSRFQCLIGKWNRSKFQLYKQTHLEIHWSAVRIWGKGQFSNLRPLASSKPPNCATPSTSFTTSHNVQARWCFRVKHLYYQLLLYALSQNLPDSGLRRKNELIHVQDMVEKGKQVNTYVRNMQNCNCFHISIYLHLLASICKHEKGIQRTFSGTSGASLRWFPLSPSFANIISTAVKE